MTDRRRIWITGIGIITAAGTGRDAFRAGLREGRSPVKRIDRFESRHEGALQAYLRQAIVNRIRDELRRAKRAPETAELPEHGRL